MFSFYYVVHVFRTFFTFCICKTVDMGTCVDMATNGECYTVVMVINFSHPPLLVSFRFHQPLFCWIVIALKKQISFIFFRWTYIIYIFLISRRRGFCNLLLFHLYPLVFIHCVNVRCMSKWSFIKRKIRHTCSCGIFWTSLYVWIIVSIVYGKKSVPFLVIRTYAAFPAMFRTLLIPVTFPNAKYSKLL